MAWTQFFHTGTYILVFVLVLLTFFQVSFGDLEKCQPMLLTPGITIPDGDIIIEEGQPLEIFCKLHDSYMSEHPNISSADMFFIANFKVLPTEWVTYINESTARLYVENPPPSRTTYTCMIKDSGVCLNSVIVGTKPSDVLNFTCISTNYEFMNCSWIEPEHYVKTTYNLTYYFPGRNSRSLYVCPNMIKYKDNGFCSWDATTRPHYRQVQSIYFFVFKISNLFGEHVQKITFQHFANVIPKPPVNLTLVNKTSESMTLKWAVKHPMNLFPPGVIYRVVYQSEYDKDEWHVANTTIINNNKTFEPIYQLTGLKYAHVLYDIRVSMRSSKARETDERMWSKNASITVRTESALPSVPPETNIGSFEIINNKNNRDVYLYWKSIPEHMKNGENLSYKIFSIEEEFGKESVIKPEEITNSYAKLSNISYKRQKYKIVSQNEIGPSVNYATIIVPSLKDRVKEPLSFTKISYGNQVYELSWTTPSNSYVKDYTIFYCRNDYDRPFQCKGYLNWTVVPGNLNVINITVPEEKIYQFAISANSETSSSGMVWASCTVIHGFTKMKSLWIDRIGSDFIEVGWKLDCSDRIGSIEGFIIYYCPIVSPVDLTCNEKLQNITISGEPIASRGRINNLRPYTTYMLTVSVQSKYSSGLPSDPLYNTTLEAAPEPPLNVTFSNIKNSSLRVNWEPPKAINGFFRFYEVKYWHNGEVHTKVPIDEQWLELTKLKAYTEYKIQVYAWTSTRSEPSKTETVRTAISYPGKMNSPNIKFQNETLILLGWDPPNEAGGKLDVYELRITEKINSKNNTKFYNTSDLQWEVSNCGTDKRYKILYFAVRAINYDRNIKFEGEWSDETENYCRDSSRSMYWLAIVLGICLFGLILYILKKLWNHCKKMRDVEVKLPPGLTPTITNDLSLNDWSGATLQKSNDDPLMHIRTDSSADEELLLAKKAECSESHDRITSGDSSGCSSGHESVTSSLASGTNLSSSSDSGTEQPRTPSSESVSRENSLRQRKTGSETLGWDSEIAWPNTNTKGYVMAMQLPDKTAVSPPSWASNKPSSPTNYCVLGVDTVNPSDTGIHGGYVPVPISIPNSDTTHVKNPSYITCDSIFNKPADHTVATLPKNPAYVKSSDTTLLGRPLATHTHTHSPQHGVKPIDMSSTYIIAGAKSRPYVKPTGPDILPTGKLINIEPMHDLSIDSYMQHSVETDKTASNTQASVLDNLERETTSPYVKTEDILNLKDPVPSKLNDELVLTSDNLEDQQPSSLNSYCRLGWDRASPPLTDAFGASALPSPRTIVMEPSKGYVPHRQFENKSLKED